MHFRTDLQAQEFQELDEQELVQRIPLENLSFGPADDAFSTHKPALWTDPAACKDLQPFNIESLSSSTSYQMPPVSLTLSDTSLLGGDGVFYHEGSSSSEDVSPPDHGFGFSVPNEDVDGDGSPCDMVQLFSPIVPSLHFEGPSRLLSAYPVMPFRSVSSSAPSILTSSDVFQEICKTSEQKLQDTSTRQVPFSPELEYIPRCCDGPQELGNPICEFDTDQAMGSQISGPGFLRLVQCSPFVDVGDGDSRNIESNDFEERVRCGHDALGIDLFNELQKDLGQMSIASENDNGYPIRLLTSEENDGHPDDTTCVVASASSEEILLGNGEDPWLCQEMPLPLIEDFRTSSVEAAMKILGVSAFLEEPVSSGRPKLEVDSDKVESALLASFQQCNPCEPDLLKVPVENLKTCLCTVHQSGANVKFWPNRTMELWIQSLTETRLLGFLSSEEFSSNCEAATKMLEVICTHSSTDQRQGDATIHCGPGRDKECETETISTQDFVFALHDDSEDTHSNRRKQTLERCDECLLKLKEKHRPILYTSALMMAKRHLQGPNVTNDLQKPKPCSFFGNVNEESIGSGHSRVTKGQSLDDFIALIDPGHCTLSTRNKESTQSCLTDIADLLHQRAVDPTELMVEMVSILLYVFSPLEPLLKKHRIMITGSSLFDQNENDLKKLRSRLQIQRRKIDHSRKMAANDELPDGEEHKSLELEKRMAFALTLLIFRRAIDILAMSGIVALIYYLEAASNKNEFQMVMSNVPASASRMQYLISASSHFLNGIYNCTSKDHAKLESLGEFFKKRKCLSTPSKKLLILIECPHLLCGKLSPANPLNKSMSHKTKTNICVSLYSNRCLLPGALCR